MIKASIIIGTLNQEKILKKTLLTLFEQLYPKDEYEVILIDSMSGDGTESMIKTLTPTCSFKYIRRENQGKVNARNFAIDLAQGKIILFTDADIPCEPNWLAKHMKYQMEFSNTAFIGQTIRQRKLDQYDTEIPKKFKMLQKVNWSYFLSGNLSIRKEYLLKAGFFDEAFKEYGWEDIELGYRLNKMGIALRFIPNALNYHFHPVNDEDLLKIMYKMGRSAAIFYKKHPNLRIKLFLGLNPLALLIFNLIKANKWLYNLIDDQPKLRYFQQQYQYLKGLTEYLND